MASTGLALLCIFAIFPFFLLISALYLRFRLRKEHEEELSVTDADIIRAIGRITKEKEAFHSVETILKKLKEIKGFKYLTVFWLERVLYHLATRSRYLTGLPRTVELLECERDGTRSNWYRLTFS